MYLFPYLYILEQVTSSLQMMSYLYPAQGLWLVLWK